MNGFYETGFISVSDVRRLAPREWRRVQVGHDEWADEWRPVYDVVDVSGPRAALAAAGYRGR